MWNTETRRKAGIQLAFWFHFVLLEADLKTTAHCANSLFRRWSQEAQWGSRSETENGKKTPIHGVVMNRVIAVGRWSSIPQRSPGRLGRTHLRAVLLKGRGKDIYLPNLISQGLLVALWTWTPQADWAHSCGERKPQGWQLQVLRSQQLAWGWWMLGHCHIV